MTKLKYLRLFENHTTHPKTEEFLELIRKFTKSTIDKQVFVEKWNELNGEKEHWFRFNGSNILYTTQQVINDLLNGTSRNHAFLKELLEDTAKSGILEIID
jgi:hypothetical protein